MICLNFLILKGKTNDGSFKHIFVLKRDLLDLGGGVNSRPVQKHCLGNSSLWLENLKSRKVAGEKAGGREAMRNLPLRLWSVSSHC